MKGNSVRGIQVCKALSDDFGMHMLRVTRTTTTSVIRSSYTAAEVRSKLSRDEASSRRLDEEGQRILVMELTGELMFVSAEIVVSTATESMTGRDCLLLDLSRVAAIDQSASTLLAELAETLLERGKEVLFTGTDRHFAFCQAVRKYFYGHKTLPNFDYADIDRALEHAEDHLLGLDQAPLREMHEVPLTEQPICRGLDESELKLLQSVLVPELFERGDMVCKEGRPADKVYFLHRGRVSASLRLDNLHDRRLGAFAAGWVFGESAFFEGHMRTADITADTRVELFSLDPQQLQNSSDANAKSLLGKLLANLAELNLSRLSRANSEIRILSR